VSDLGSWCMYCLAWSVRYPTTVIEVSLPGQHSGSWPRIATPPTIRALCEWLARMGVEHPEGTFVLNGLFNAFTAAGTWHGDIVCDNHARELVPVPGRTL
jgi:hypothetical protein